MDEVIVKESKELKYTIFGNEAKNPVAYCTLHHGALTTKQMKLKGCLCKQCWHLRKNEEHEYWRQREIKKAKKKGKRMVTA